MTHPTQVEQTTQSALAVSASEFVALMNALAEAWNAGEGARAAELFTSDAIYQEPPDGPHFSGRDAIRRHFVGDGAESRPPMKMQWHHLAFEPSTGVGFGEYSFEMYSRCHGVVVIQLQGWLIRRWREYRYKSALSWEAFTAANPF